MTAPPTYCQSLGLAEPPRLTDFVARPQIKLFQLLVLALLEHGGPVTIAAIANRLAALGVQAPTGDLVYSLTKAWHGLPPVRRETDGAMRLDLSSPQLEYLLLDCGLRHPPITTIQQQVSLPVPDATVPVTRVEWEALHQHPTSTSFSNERTVAALLESHGSPMTLEEVNRHLEHLPQRGRKILPDRLRHWRGRLVTLEPGPVFRLRDEPRELASMRQAVRSYAYLILHRQAVRQAWEHQRERALALRKQHTTAASTPPATSLRRAVIRAYPGSGKPAALSILDLQTRTLDTHVGQDARTLIQALEPYDLLIGLDPLATLAGLGAASERWRLTHLDRHPKTRTINRQGRTIHITTDMLISASVGISRALYDPRKMRAYVVDGDQTRLTRRLESDVKALAAFNRYGCLHHGLRLRWGFLHEFIAVAWNHPDDLSLVDLVQEAERRGVEVEMVLGSAPGWADPWVRARRGRLTLHYGSAILHTATGEETFDRYDIQAVRLVDFQPGPLPVQAP